MILTFNDLPAWLWGRSDVIKQLKQNFLKRVSESEKTVQLIKQLLLQYYESDDLNRNKVRAITAISRGAVLGGALRGGFYGLTWLALLVYSRGKLKNEMKIKHIVSETLRYAGFMGSFAGTYVIMDELIKSIVGNHRSYNWRSFAAGVCAGPTIMIIGGGPHESVATYIFVRGLALLIRIGNQPESKSWVRKLLAPTRFAYGDVGMMCACASTIVHTAIMLPETMPKSYHRFLMRMLNIPISSVYAIQEQLKRQNVATCSCSHPANPLGAEYGVYKSLKNTMIEGYSGLSIHELLHPGHTCVQNLMSWLPQMAGRAMRVYLPVHLIPAILVHRKELLKMPHTILPRLLFSWLRSSAFLTTYAGMAVGSVCATSSIFGFINGPMLAASVFPCGLATLIEKRSRRVELMMYCVARTLESILPILVARGVLAPSVLNIRTDVMIFSVAVGAILHAYSDNKGKYRALFRSKYLNVLDWTMGNSGYGDGRIRHVPSNQDYLVRLGKAVSTASLASLTSAQDTPKVKVPSNETTDSNDTSVHSTATSPAEQVSPQLALARQGSWPGFGKGEDGDCDVDTPRASGVVAVGREGQRDSEGGRESEGEVECENSLCESEKLSQSDSLSQNSVCNTSQSFQSAE